MEIPRAPNGWTVVTPSVNMVPPCNARAPPSFHPANVRSSDYHMASPYSVHSRSPSSDIRLSPHQHSANLKATSSLDPHRHGGYNSHPPPSYRNPMPLPSSQAGLSLDISVLSMRDSGSESHLKEEFSLPPIQAPDSSSSSPSLFTLPPISCMEDARGIAPQDSAAVLRRLRMDDDGYSKAGRSSEDHAWPRRHSSSTQSSSPYVFFRPLAGYQENSRLAFTETS